MRSETTDAVSKEMDNDIKLSDYYKGMVDDYANRHEKRFKEITNLYDRKIKLLESEIVFLEKENAALKERVNELEN